MAPKFFFLDGFERVRETIGGKKTIEHQSTHVFAHDFFLKEKKNNARNFFSGKIPVRIFFSAIERTDSLVSKSAMVVVDAGAPRVFEFLFFLCDTLFLRCFFLKKTIGGNF
jgi:hypothetical protein